MSKQQQQQQQQQRQQQQQHSLIGRVTQHIKDIGGAATAATTPCVAAAAATADAAAGFVAVQLPIARFCFLTLFAFVCPAGFNAVRLPMNFTNLQKDLPRPKWDATEFYACVVGCKVITHLILRSIRCGATLGLM
jgi:hypothetical protein